MPAAAVIPAPIAYIKVVAVKKLVVGFLLKTLGPLYECVSGAVFGIPWENVSALNCVVRPLPRFYFEEIRVFTAGIVRCEDVSME